MKKTLLFVLTVALFAVASTTLSRVSAQASKYGDASVERAADAAFRDGLYLGGLDAANGRARHVSAGRWGTDADRTLFRSGYEAGYGHASPTVTQ